MIRQLNQIPTYIYSALHFIAKKGIMMSKPKCSEKPQLHNLSLIISPLQKREKNTEEKPNISYEHYHPREN